MKVIRKDRVKAIWKTITLPDGRQIRIKELTLEERLRIAAQSIVESSHFASYRTVKNLIRVAKENYCAAMDQMLLTPRQKAAIVGHKVSEQRKALDPRVQELLTLEPEILLWIAKNIGRVRLATRYRSESQLDGMLPPAALSDEEERRVCEGVNLKSKRYERFLDKWETKSKERTKARRKLERKQGIKKEEPAKRPRKRRRKHGSYADYVRKLVGGLAGRDIKVV